MTRSLICKICGTGFETANKGRPAPACEQHKKQYRTEYLRAAGKKYRETQKQREALAQQLGATHGQDSTRETSDQ